MGRVFNDYGKYYDLIYSDKDYEKECDFIEAAFRKYSRFKPKKLLDVGCGTGGHAIPLAKRGYHVTGVDISRTMIKIAKEKTGKIGLDLDFRVNDLRKLQLHQKFDACICMFAVMDYLTTNKDVIAALTNIRRHLKKDSLFIFDFWYGPAVITLLPSSRLKKMAKNGLKVVRFAEPSLDSLHHLCTVSYHLIIIKENKILNEINEKHVIRFYFPEEIKHYLEENGFELLKLCSFPDLDADVKEDSWNVAAVACACTQKR